LRLFLSEKNLSFGENIVKPWALPDDLAALGPGFMPPLLVESDGAILAGDQAIVEYIEEVHTTSSLLGSDALSRAEVRRVVGWFDRDFRHDVIETLLTEKLFRRLAGLGEPASTAVRAGHAALAQYLSAMATLVERSGWLAGEELSLADLTAGAYLSAIDYLGDINWDQEPDVRMWYARVKSRPSFRPLLADRIAGMPPALHYADLDF